MLFPLEPADRTDERASMPTRLAPPAPHRGKRLAPARIAVTLGILIAAMLAFSLVLAGCIETSPTSTTPASPAANNASESTDAREATADTTIDEDGSYTSKDEVALYIHTYRHLPGNFVSKTKARAAGWDSDAGNLAEVLPGKSIGGSRFYNDEGALPDAKGRTTSKIILGVELMCCFRLYLRCIFLILLAMPSIHWLHLPSQLLTMFQLRHLRS